MAEDKIRKVYDMLVAHASYQDSFDEFNGFMDNSENRRQVYDKLVKYTGYQDSFDEFEGYVMPKQSAPPIMEKDEPALQAGIGGKTATEPKVEPVQQAEPAAYGFNVGDAIKWRGKAYRIEGMRRDGARVMLDGDPTVRVLTFAQLAEAEPFEAWNPSASQKAALQMQAGMIGRQFDANIENGAERMRNVAKYGASSAAIKGEPMKADMEFDPATGKAVQSYITPYGDKTADLDKANEAAREFREDRFAVSIPGQIKNAQSRVAYLEKEIEKRTKEVLAQSDARRSEKSAFERFAEGMTTKGDGYTDALMSDPALNSLKLSLRQAQERLQALENKSDHDSNGGFWRDFRRGAWQAVSDGRAWDFGMGDFRDAATMMTIASKHDKGQQLTDEEQGAMEDIALNQAVLSQFGDLGRGYRWGDIAGTSISFMKDFFLTGGGYGGMPALFTRGATKVATKAGMKFATEVAERAAKRGLMNFVKAEGISGVGSLVREQAAPWLVKALGTTADDLLIRAPLLAGTLQGMSTASKIIERKLGNVKYDAESGQYAFENGETWSNAIWQAGADQIIENFSEISGGHMPGAIAAARAFGARDLTAAMLRMTRENAGTAISKAAKFLGRAGVNGYLGEVGEELYGQAWRTLLRLDSAYGEDGQNLFKSGQFYGDTFCGMALSIGLTGGGAIAASSGMKYAGQAVDYYAMRKAINNTDRRAAQSLSSEVWDPMRMIIDATDNANIGALADQVWADKSMTTQQKSAVLDYMEASMVMRGHNLREFVSQPSEQEHAGRSAMADAYAEGMSIGNAEDRNRARMSLNYQSEQLRNALGIAEHANIPEVLASMYGTNDISEIVTALYADKSVREEERAAIAEYLVAANRYNGMMQAATDAIEAEVLEQKAFIDERSDNSDAGNPMLRPAILKANDEQVFIVGGHVQMLPDNTMVDVAKSDRFIVVRDLSGNTRSIDAADILALSQPESAKDAKARMSAQTRDRRMEEMLAQINGLASTNPGDMVPVQAEGEIVDAQVVANTGNGYVTVALPDGSQADVSADQVQALSDERNEAAFRAEIERDKEIGDPGAEAESVPGSASAEFSIHDIIVFGKDSAGDASGAEGRIIDIDRSDPAAPQYGVEYTTTNGDTRVMYKTAEELVEMNATATAPAEQPAYAKGKITVRRDDGKEEFGCLTGYVDEDGKYEYYLESDISPYVEGKLKTLRYASKEELDGMVVDFIPEEDALPLPIQGQQALSDDVAPADSGAIEQASVPENVETVPNAAENVASAVENEPEAVPTAEPTPLQRTPRNERGEPIFEQAETPEDGWDALVEFSEGDAETARVIADTMAEEKRKAYEKAQKLKPKGKSPAEILASKKANAAALATAQAEYEQWQRIAGVQQARDEAARLQEEAERAELEAQAREEARIKAEEEAKWQQQKASLDKRLRETAEKYRDVPEAIEILEQNRPLTIDEVAASVLANNKVLWGNKESGGNLLKAGARYHVGIGEGERRKLFGLFASEAKGGKSIERLAEDVFKETCEENGVPYDNGEALDALIEVIRTANTMGDIRNYITNKRIEQAEQIGEEARRREAEAADEFCHEMYGMSAVEYDAYEEQLESQAKMLYENLDEQEYYANIADEIINSQRLEDEYRRSQETLASRTDQQGDRGNQVLHQPQSAQASGVEGSEGENPWSGQGNWNQGNDSNGRLPEMAGAEGGARGPGDIQPADERQGDLQPAKTAKVSYKLSEEVDEDGSPFVLSSKGNTDFGVIPADSGLASAPIKLSLGNSKYGLKHLERRHGDEIRKAGFDTVESFVEYVANNFSHIREGENSMGDANGTYLLQLEDAHNNTLYVELSSDGSYWGVNSGGVFRKGYGKNKKEVWSASEEQNKQSVADNTLRMEDNADNPTVPNGTVSNTSYDKVNALPSNKQISDEESSLQLADDEDVHTEQPSIQASVQAASAEVNTEPTPAQAEAGNYKKGHVTIGEFDITIENPAGSVRRGVDADGNPWETTMANAYGYIRGTESVDGDHIDVFLAEDMDWWDARRVFVIDQTKEDGSFDEHKVMLGFNDGYDAMQAYLANYDPSWLDKHPGIRISEVNIEDFNKWIKSSRRKTKPFADYKSVTPVNTKPSNINPVRTDANHTEATQISDLNGVSDEKVNDSSLDKQEGDAENSKNYTIAPAVYTNKKGNETPMHRLTFGRDLNEDEEVAIKKFAREKLGNGRFAPARGWKDRENGSWLFRTEEDARNAGELVGKEGFVADNRVLAREEIADEFAPAEDFMSMAARFAHGAERANEATERVREIAHTLDFNGDALSPSDIVATINELQSLWEELDSINAEGEPIAAVAMTQALIESELRRWRQHDVSLSASKPWEEMSPAERLEAASAAPLSDEEIRGSAADEIIKANAIRYINGDNSLINQVSYLNIYNDVRSTDRSNTASVSGQQLADADSEESDRLGEGGANGNSAVPVGREGDAEIVSRERTDGEDSPQRDVPGSGEQGDSGVRKQESAVGAVSANSGKRGRSGSDSGNGRDGRRKRGTAGRAGAANDGRGKSEAGSVDNGSVDGSVKSADEELKSAFDDFKQILKEFGNAGREQLSLSIIGLNSKQAEMLPRVIVAGAKLGFALLRKGLTSFNAWQREMRSMIAPLLKGVGIKDAAVDEWIEEMWNCSLPINGETRTIAEWASIMGRENLRKHMASTLDEKRAQQQAAESIVVKTCDIGNIRETLPFLLPQQQEDVLKAETQFFDQSHQDEAHAYGKGYMFTNGTGTGKTYTGLGIVKRFIKQGRGRVLILTPSQTKVNDWINDAQNMSIDLRSLDDWAKERGTNATAEAGSGAVISTFANFRQNDALQGEDFDLIVYDESHRLLENKKGEATAGVVQHYKLSNKNEGYAFSRLQQANPLFREIQAANQDFRDKCSLLVERMKKDTGKANERDLAANELIPPSINDHWSESVQARFPELSSLRDKIVSLEREYASEVKPRLELKAKESVARTKVVFLSATPFNTRENLDYAEGYIFSYPKSDNSRISGRTRFFLDHFGSAYRYRYNRLESSATNPQAIAQQEVDFSDYLQNTLCTMSGRVIDSEHDYSRDFPTVTGEYAQRFNQAVAEFYRSDAMGRACHDVLGDYAYSSALFESMKVSQIAPRIKEHISKGRKVVVFHRRVETSAPLRKPFESIFAAAKNYADLEHDKEKQTQLHKEISSMRRRFADMLQWEKTIDLRMPREQLADMFGKENVLFFSGRESVKQKNDAVKKFNDDESGKNIIVIQEASGKEGISLHDTTGNHQRVLITLALPQSPITALQTEGRIYRIGNRSNAIFEYPLLGLDSEMILFGSKFNSQVGTTENLALGSNARNLRDSFARGVEEHSGEVPLDSQGVGGKEFDGKQETASDPFDRAVLDFYGNQKLSGRRDNRDGADYYPTPEPLGYMMNAWGRIGEGESVLEPSAGHGAIARYVPQENMLTAIEPSMSLFSRLQVKCGGVGRRFENRIFESYNAVNKHDVVLMNPPFGTAGRLAVDHVAKAFGHLEEGGRVVAIIPRGSADRKFDAWISGQKDALLAGEVLLPAITFQQAGTAVSSRVVVIDKVTDGNLRRQASSNARHIDLSAHPYSRIEDFFEDLRGIEMPARTIDHNARMRKKALPAARDMREIKGMRSVDVTANSIRVHGRGVWETLEWGGKKPEELRGYLMGKFKQYTQEQKKAEEWNYECAMASYAELRALAAKLAGMSVEEMERAAGMNASASEPEALYNSGKSANFAGVYETQEGKTISYASEREQPYGSLFDFDFTAENEAAAGHGDIRRASEIQRAGISGESEPGSGLIREGQGEYARVERIFMETGSFSFTSAERIESAADVAYIFSALEDSAKEHSFIVLVKNGTPTVVELGMGTFYGTLVDIPTASLAYNRIRPDEVYFVHNHPSGNLICSGQDVETLKTLEEISDTPVHGVIINLKTGRFGTFDTKGNKAIADKRVPEKEIALSLHSLDKQIFSRDYDPLSQPLALSSRDVAAFLNSHRMGDRAKVSFLILSRSGRIVGNIHTPFTDISANVREKARYISERVIQFGGESAILYGDFELNPAREPELRALEDQMQQMGSRLIDVVKADGNFTKSASDEGLLHEPGSEYGADADARFRLGDPQETKIEVLNSNKPSTSNGTTNSEQTRLGSASLLKDTEIHNKSGEEILQESKIADKNAHQQEMAQTSAEAKRGHAEKLSKKFNTPVRIVESVDELTNADPEMQERMRASKGFYDPATGEVVVVVSNNASVEDVAETVFHEVVAHKGLRELVGEENYGAFCDEVYGRLDSASKNGVDIDAARRFMADPAKGLGYHRRVAVDEMFGRLAEKGFEDFTKAERGIWAKLRAKALEAINKFLGSLRLPKWVKLGDNELRYMLWRSHERLTSKSDYVDMARDAAKRDELGLSLLSRRPMRTFTKEEIAQIADGEAELFSSPAERVVIGDSHDLSEYLNSIGIEEDDIEYAIQSFESKQDSGTALVAFYDPQSKKIIIFADKCLSNAALIGALKHEELHHQIDVNAELKNSVSVLAPELKRMRSSLWHDIQTYYSDCDLTEQEEELVVYAIEEAIKDMVLDGVYGRLGKESKIEFEKLLSTIGYEKKLVRESAGLFNRTKRKVSPLSQRGQGALGQRAENESATGGTGPTEQGERENFGSGAGELRFRSASYANAREEYEAHVRTITERDKRTGDVRTDSQGNKKKANRAAMWHEAYLDSMASLKALQDAVSHETGKPIEQFENAYWAENRMSSSNRAQTDAWKVRYFEPLMKEVAKLSGKEKGGYRELLDYMMAKHGLERNEYMRNQAQANGEDVDRDFAGLTALFDLAPQDWDEAERLAQDLVKAYESARSTSTLWQLVNAATKSTLQTRYDAGLISKDVYDKIRTQYSCYIPLKGWADTVAGDVYEYAAGTYHLGSALHSAFGRNSMADDPLANIAVDGERTIMEANRNRMKMALLNMAINHKTSLLTVSRQWYEKRSDGSWIEANPQIPENASADEVNAIVGQFNAQMKALEKNGDARRSKQGLRLGMRTDKHEQSQHIITVKRAGEEFNVIINGNPRAALAVNGMLNPDAGKPTRFKNYAQKVKNFMAKTFTTWNPEFVVGNLARDVMFAGVAVAIKEDSAYNKQYAKNIAGLLLKVKKDEKGERGNIVSLLSRYNNGKLDMKNDAERYFYEFLTNGGETGFTQLNSVDKVKKDMERFIKQAQGGASSIPRKAWDGLFDGIEFMNRCAEDVTRFAVYMTSRQAGRSVAESIWNAKEITVNFNKKGSGALGARYLNFLYVFFNAAMQAAGNAGRLIKNHPVKSTIAMTSFMVGGFLMPMMLWGLWALFGGDPDEYFKLPEWVRRNNIVIRIPFTDMFFTIPIAHELRPFYGIGELAFSTLCGEENAEDALLKAAEGFTGILPVDWTGNGGNVLVSLTPTIAQPIVQVMANVDYFGKPIYKRTAFNAEDPEWTKAYRSTHPAFVNASKWLYEKTATVNEAGRPVGRRYGDINPAIAQYLIEAYTGGMGKAINKTSRTLSMLWDADARELRNVPIASKFVQNIDERAVERRNNNAYYDLTDEYEELKEDFRHLNEQPLDSVTGHAKKLTDWLSTPKGRRYLIMRDYAKDVDYWHRIGRDASTDSMRQSADSMESDAKEQMIEMLRTPEAYPDSVINRRIKELDKARMRQEHNTDKRMRRAERRIGD